MTLTDALRTIDHGLQWLPEAMRSDQARAMMLAIGLQESRFTHRRQIKGPARGYWQFEQGGGVRSVLNHRHTQAHAVAAMEAMDYPPTVDAAYNALSDNDALAVVFARLLLYSLPQAPPNNAITGWNQYLSAWRPGKPHPNTWPSFWVQANKAVFGWID
jgi:hypothetical protein